MEPWHEHANATDQVGYIPTMPREQTVSRRFRLVASPWPVFTEAKTFCWSPIRQICSYLVGQCTLALPGSAKIYKPETWKSLWRAPFASVPSKSVNFYLLTCPRCVCISPYALSPLPTPLYARVQIIKWPLIQPTPPTFSFFLPVPLTEHSFPMETYFAFQWVPTALRRRQIDPRWPERSSASLALFQPLIFFYLFCPWAFAITVTLTLCSLPATSLPHTLDLSSGLTPWHQALGKY